MQDGRDAAREQGAGAKKGESEREERHWAMREGKLERRDEPFRVHPSIQGSGSLLGSLLFSVHGLLYYLTFDVWLVSFFPGRGKQMDGGQHGKGRAGSRAVEVYIFQCNK